MSRGRARLGATLGFLLAAAAARQASAQMPEAPPGKWWKRPRIAQLLNLTGEQQTKLDEIFARHRRDFVDLKADVERHQIDVDELVAKKDSDPRKVSSAVDALEQSRLKLRKAATMMFLEQKDVLSAAQWQQILDRRDEWRRERQMERRGQSPDGGPDGPGRWHSDRPRDQRPADEKSPDQKSSDQKPPDR